MKTKKKKKNSVGVYSDYSESRVAGGEWREAGPVGDKNIITS